MQKLHHKRRLWIVAAVFLLGMAVLAAIMLNLREKRIAQLTNLSYMNAQQRAMDLKRELDDSIELTETLKLLIMESDTHTLKNFDETARYMMESRSYIASLQLAPGGTVTDIYPLRGNEAGKIDLFADDIRGPVVTYSKKTGKATMQGPFPLKQGGTGIAVRQPVYVKDAEGKSTFWGFTVAIIKVPDVFKGSISSLNAFGYDYALYETSLLTEQKQKVVTSNEEMSSPVHATFVSGACSWELEVMPQSGWDADSDLLPYAILGVVLAVLFTILSYLVLLLDEDREKFRKIVDTRMNEQK